MSRHEIDLREMPSKQKHHFNLWNPQHPTVVFIGTVAIGLTFYEMTEEVDVTWHNGKTVRVSSLPVSKRPVTNRFSTDVRKGSLPSERFCLQAYSPYPETDWVNRWQESRVGELREKLQTISQGLRDAAPKVAVQVAEATRKREERCRQQELQWQRYEAEQEVKRRAKALQDSRDELAEIIAGWTRAKQIEEFFLDAQRRAELQESSQSAQILERLRKARELAGGIDALARFQTWRAPDER